MGGVECGVSMYVVKRKELMAVAHLLPINIILSQSLQQSIIVAITGRSLGHHQFCGVALVVFSFNASYCGIGPFTLFGIVTESEVTWLIVLVFNCNKLGNGKSLPRV